METDFKKTATALWHYDLDATRRRKLWDLIECNEDVYRAEKMEADAVRKVQLAYFEDTKTLNSLNSCLCCDIAFMRRMCASYKLSLKEFIKDRLPIRYAVIKLGYMIVGAGRTKEEAIANAEGAMPGVTGQIVEDAGDCMPDGEIFVAEVDNDYWDDYFKDYNCFEKIGENWYIKI